MSQARSNSVPSAAGAGQVAGPQAAAPTSSAAAVQLKAALKGASFEAQAAMLAPPVQAKGAPEGDVHAAAAAGTKGGGGALPHGDTIQKAFGSHDVSGIKAHTGGEASQASAAMGAKAFASGDHVAFGGAPDLHTAAHEAAHVVQQKGGVQLAGGVGQSGDKYEQHADQVADAVVAGKSAEGLLDQHAGGGSAAVQKREVQRLATPDAQKGIVGGKTTLEDYNGGAVSDAAKEKARQKQDSENAMTLAQQAATIATQTASSDQEVCAAIAAGTVPRYLARVSSRADFGRGTFGNPGKPFVFATEPSALRGCKPGQALIKVGWTKKWLTDKIGQEIVVCIFDTKSPVPNKDGSGAQALVKTGSMEWSALATEALGNAKFQTELAAANIPAAQVPECFRILKATPVGAAPKTTDAKLSGWCVAIRDMIDRVFSANWLYSGMGATVGQDGKLGGREVMCKENGTGLKLTPTNSQLVSLGTLTQGEVDAMTDYGK
ncbi:MAG: DUF4157 domain-containing protein [Myxococcota bacterium]